MADAIPGIARRPEKKGKDYLLAIGIDDYVHVRPKLDNAVKDVKDFVELMVDRFGFDYENIRPIHNEQATYEGILTEFRNLIAKVTPEDNVLIYFSGHGVLDEMLDEGYWIPVDAESGKINQYFPNSTLKKILDRIDSFHTFIIVDSCFSGALFLEGKSRFVSDAYNFPSRWGLASGRKTIVSDGDPGQNSPFSMALLNVLKHQEEGLNVGALIDLVKQSVAANTNKRQIPIGDPLCIEGHQGGQFIFQPLESLELAWLNAQEINTPQVYQDFLNKFPQSSYSEIAWWNIAVLLETPQAYDDYLEQYYDGKFATQALEKLRILSDENAWIQANRQNSLLSYREYAVHFSHGRYIAETRQRIEALRNTLAPALREPSELVNFISDQMLLIKGGAFDMGYRFGLKKEEEETLHPVILNDYYLSKYAVTLDAFKRFIDDTNYQTDADKDGGSYIRNGNRWEKMNGVNWKYDTEGKIRPITEYQHPVIHVSWNDAIVYCNWLSQKENLQPVYEIKETVTPDWSANGYRLPTEAEWMYADRAREQHTNTPKEKTTFKINPSIVGVFKKKKTIPVNSIQNLNILGLFNMTGNIYEWCWDWYHELPLSLVINPKGALNGTYRVYKGGTHISEGPAVLRFQNYPFYRSDGIGFRIAQNI